MEVLIILLLLIGLGVAGFFYFNKVRSSQIGQRTETWARSERQPTEKPVTREVTVETLRPGDAVSFWDGEDAIVDTVLDVKEELGGRTTRWRWNLLRGGRVLETAPDDNVLYMTSEVFHQGSTGFQDFTGEVAQGGVLKTFEARVRAGTAGSNPVYYPYQGKQFKVQSTGSFSVTPIGAPARAEVWRDVSDDPGQNTYWEMEAEDGTQGLGLWTTHVLLLTGETLKVSDIRNLFAGSGDGPA